MWPEVSKRINFPIKRQLVAIQNEGNIDFTDPVTMFCVSWATMYVANGAAEHLIHSWNHHRIHEAVTNMEQTSCAVKLPDELIPSVSEAVRIYEEMGGNLTRDATFGIDPLTARADLIESRERLFLSDQPSGQSIFADIVHGQSPSLKQAILYFVDITVYLAGFLSE